MKHRAVLEVDLDLLKNNCKLLQKMTGDSFFCPMLKADAYGHGAVPIAKTLLAMGVKQVGVITVAEAWAIRESVKGMDILIFSPLLSREDLSWIFEEQLVVVCSQWEDLHNLSKFKKPIRIHLKFNTGFSRLGFPLSEAEEICKFLKDNPQIQLQALATQLIAGEDLEGVSSQQLIQFKNLKKYFSCSHFHVLNTSALISSFIHRKSGFGSRPGIGLYGVKPEVSFQNHSAKKSWNQLLFHPVSCLKSYIVALHSLPKGALVSYGGRWEASRSSQIAVVSLGYGDGLFRSVKSQRDVLLRGKKRSIVGTVCMDFFMIDVTDCFDGKQAPLQLGEEVVIFGQQGDHFLSPENQASASGTIVYELFVRLSGRIHRAYKTGVQHV